MSTDRVAQLQAVQNEALSLFVRKHRDYADSFAQHGIVGIIVRIGDKLARCVQVGSSAVAVVSTETLRDTLIDLANYAAMGVALIDEQLEQGAWPEDDDPFSDGGEDDD